MLPESLNIHHYSKIENKNYNRTVQQRIKNLLSSGKKPAVFGNMVVEKYSSVFYELRRKNTSRVRLLRQFKQNKLIELDLDIKKNVKKNKNLRQKSQN